MDKKLDNIENKLMLIREMILELSEEINKTNEFLYEIYGKEVSSYLSKNNDK